MNILLVSDLHCGGDTGKNIPALSDKMIAEIDRSKINIVIVAGDLTAHGYDGIITNQWLFPIFGPNSWITGGSSVNELQMLKDQFVYRVGAQQNVYMFLMNGNHDLNNGAGRNPVCDYITSIYHNTFYVVQYNGYFFFMCGLYPTAGINSWIQQQMQMHGITNQTPLFFSFHYNLTGDMSDWWSEAEKDAFYATIQGKNVVGIFVGHRHESYQNEWKGIKVVSAGGFSFAKMSPQGNELNLSWVSF